jgi:hypothetical protein
MKCSFYGNDLKSVNNVNNSECGGLCFNTPGCTHFAWTKVNGGTCQMKNGTVSKIDAFVVSDPSAVCGIVRLPTSISWRLDGSASQCDFSNNDLSNQKSISGSQCRSLCLITSYCTHFTWTSYNGGTCWMKYNPVSRDDAFSTTDTSMICGIVVQSSSTSSINWDPDDWAMQCDFENHDFANENIEGSQCRGLCARTCGCTHFTWTSYNGGTCWMKYGAVSKSDAYNVSDTSQVCGIVVRNSIDWKPENWAEQCDFLNRDLKNAKNVQGRDCGPLCVKTPGCTHFTWNASDGGDCRLKYGGVI